MGRHAPRLALAMRVFFSAGLIAPALLSACVNTATPSPQSIAPIHDFAEIAGRWEGILTLTPPEYGDDQVAVVIHPDGTYQFSSFREKGRFHGNGRLRLDSGQAVEQVNGQSVTFTLYVRDSRRVLRVEGSGYGLEYAGNLTTAG